VRAAEPYVANLTAIALIRIQVLGMRWVRWRWEIALSTREYALTKELLDICFLRQGQIDVSTPNIIIIKNMIRSCLNAGGRWRLEMRWRLPYRHACFTRMLCKLLVMLQ